MLGAYFAGTQIRFDIASHTTNTTDQNLTQENSIITEKRELGLFPGTVVGPVYPGYEFTNLNGARIADITWSGSALEQSLTKSSKTPKTDSFFFNGGCYFEASESEKINNTPENFCYHDVAYYADEDTVNQHVLDKTHKNKPLSAMVSGQYGKGKFLLSGVHFETPEAYLQEQDLLHLLPAYKPTANNSPIHQLIKSLLQ